jgi:hypothetical protein
METSTKFIDFHLKGVLKGDFIKSLLKEGVLGKEGAKSSSPRKFHPQGLTDSDVNVSAHPALIIQSLFLATSPYLMAPPIPG